MMNQLTSSIYGISLSFAISHQYLLIITPYSSNIKTTKQMPLFTRLDSAVESELGPPILFHSRRII